MAPEYTLRPATIADADTLVHHRLAMFTDMGSEYDAVVLDAAFRAWLAQLMPSGAYRAWLVETDTGEVAAGAGITVVPWPPGPRYPGERLAFVYNVYTEPAHRRRGLGRLMMDAIHRWCRANGVRSVALNASRDGQRLYEAMGYIESPAPMMFLTLDP
ncbi:MAG TPA: GNAT family N-acetyltransferase [Vicinamibacterales bacterium]|nr:GNAT family N-acetyltransferase [Vicinamibacterales bacterium]